MSDSDAESAPTLPSDAKIEQALRRIVRDIWLSGDRDNVTVNVVRKSAEEQLRLPDGFLKRDSTWKTRSKEVITDQFNVQQHQEQDGPAYSEKPQRKAAAPKSSSTMHKLKAPTKKQTTAFAKPKGRKRQQVSISSEDEDGGTSIRSDASEPTMPSRKKLTKRPHVHGEDPGDENEASPAPDPASSREKSPQPVPTEDSHGNANMQVKSMSSAEDGKDTHSESEMSVLVDELPKKKRGKKIVPTKEKSSKATSKKSTAKGEEADTDEAEIKRLQGWLVKCGIRKLWGKELKPYDSSKAKINHLKQMLRDAGMEGRYSIEKARQIKERRELAADLEAVQEGAKRWGQSESEEDDGARPRRRLAKGLKDLEGLIESEDEESD